MIIIIIIILMAKLYEEYQCRKAFPKLLISQLRSKYSTVLNTLLVVITLYDGEVSC